VARCGRLRAQFHDCDAPRAGRILQQQVRAAPDGGSVRVILDLKHVGLILSAGTAVGLRFFSDVSFATIQQNVAAVGLDVAHVTLASFGALVLQTELDQLHRDWFNLSPRAPAQVVVLLGVPVGLYAALRRVLTPEKAAAAVLLLIPLLPMVATVVVCAWVIGRAAYAL